MDNFELTDKSYILDEYVSVHSCDIAQETVNNKFVLGIGYRKDKFKIVFFKSNVKTALEPAFTTTLNFNQSDIKFTTVKL